jgi:Tol biopolymer transport system component
MHSRLLVALWVFLVVALIVGCGGGGVGGGLSTSSTATVTGTGTNGNAGTNTTTGSTGTTGTTGTTTTSTTGTTSSTGTNTTGTSGTTGTTGSSGTTGTTGGVIQADEVVYRTNRNALTIDIYVSKIQGSFPVRLTLDAALYRELAVSPDGTRIAVARAPVGNDLANEIWVMDADGTGLTQLTSNPGSPSRAPAWSPDGSKIAFYRLTGSTTDVWVMNSDGSGQTKLTTSGAASAREPAWSPDGMKIAFVAGSSTSNIFVMDANGSNQANVTNFSGSSGPNSPCWSPDGNKIVFENGDLYIMDANGSNLTVINLGGLNPEQPFFSPDGRIAFVASTGSLDSDIWLANVDGTGVGRITTEPFGEGYPRFRLNP